MSNYVKLNNIDHKDLKIIRHHSPELGDDVMCAVTFPQEFRAVQGVYPIFFQKDASSGKFYPMAMFGLREKENLFLTAAGWDANYIPLSIKRKPFLIGVQPGDDSSENNMMVYIDMNSPRISSSEGEEVFLPHGGHSTYLESVVTMLDYIGFGNATSEEFVDELLKHDLLESFSLDIELNNGSQNKLVGFYTINEDKMKTLTADALASLHAKGYVEYIYMVIASMSKISDLITRIEARIAAQ